jgi:hypothetical protein
MKARVIQMSLVEVRPEPVPQAAQDGGVALEGIGRMAVLDLQTLPLPRNAPSTGIEMGGDSTLSLQACDGGPSQLSLGC